MALRSVDQWRLWILAVVVAVAIVGLFVFSFVGTFVFGLFVYYGARPVHREISDHLDGRSATATATMLALVLPVLALVGYTGLVAFNELTAFVGPETVGMLLERLPGDPRSLSSVLDDPAAFVRRIDEPSEIRERLFALLSTAGLVGSALLRLTLALSFAFFLLRDGDRLDEWFRGRVAGADSSAHSFLRGVDADLENVYFGNFATVISVGAAAIVVYNAYNLLAPDAVTLPVPTLLGLLTGLATFVPIVVGKLVYVPASGYALWRAVGVETGYVPAIALLVVSFLLLDIIPQTFVRPLLSGQSLHSGLVLFAYILGAALFGWYGLFLGPLLAVVVVQVLAHAFPHVVAGEDVDSDPEGMDIGSDPTPGEVGIDDPDEGPAGESDAGVGSGSDDRSGADSRRDPADGS